ncbi:hypothetical protein SPRG_02306 [Saprolegnia parasitica CBS 223.65]|uniref:protein-tyrosine-phosphatase n=1 Tax=Saprolegnia parasitica (strain CBS 223.65) TaxID=695850 RepID=A0A067CSJ1_SAPPC|nr:hypothetical protein SPRG_02306 [Saprolegnia parasitica CBS 223.65]KDO33498.1 hypothetical protein SPRG_02306 [Saprolegnia parasitica CBS 223.65]|eukprot:XP_012196241.1 hypothetical protein SPRG_02306 [Saprolegnia parasitica CBS 223.65]
MDGNAPPPTGPSKPAKDAFRKFWHGLLLQKYVDTDRDLVEILPHLYLGSIGAGANYEALVRLRITHILVASETIVFPFEDKPEGFVYERVAIADVPSASIEAHFAASNAFIERTTTSGGNVLVHCFAGKSRSVTLILAYLMAHYGYSLGDALAHVRSLRPQAQPNQGFMRQLEAYAEQLRAQSPEKGQEM